MSADDSQRKILSRKELAKELRRNAYQRAKERRAKDPRFIAMKEAAKEQRRAAYQKLKEKRKSEEAAAKAISKADRGSRLTQERAEAQTRALQKSKQVMQTADQWAAGKAQNASHDNEGSEGVRSSRLEDALELVEGSWLVKGSDVEN
jgi:hypothetical protein